MALADTLVSKPPPIREDGHGVFRVGRSRVSLETILGEFKDGASAEEIAAAFDTVSLADIYAVIGYYLENRDEVEAYLKRAEEEGDAIQREMEQRFPPHGLRERLLARLQNKA